MRVMNENLNLVEILKDCPKGTKLYSTIFGEVEFGFIEDHSTYPIVLMVNGGRGYLTSEGKLYNQFDGECTLFPSREERDWSKFKTKKQRFDPKTLQPFDKVLVRYAKGRIWLPDLFGYKDDIGTICVANGCTKRECIPYNDETKHLLGTSDEAPKFYRYWED